MEKCQKCGSDNTQVYDSDYEEIYMDYTDDSDLPSYETRLVETWDCNNCGHTWKELAREG